MEFVKRLFGSKEAYQPNVEETIFSATFEKEKQIVSALNMVGAGFEARGGSSLMLTEAVENGVDAIIKLNPIQKGRGNIKVIIDQVNERILVIDNGTGFLQIKHVCEKPFDSLKEMDETQTGKFARGLQGFRAFCNNLSYITKRLPKDIPSDESQYIKPAINDSNLIVRLDFVSTTSQVKVKYVHDDEFKEFLKEEHGAIAIYEKWKPGLFEKFNINMLFRRLQHHFGELIRQSEISIVVELRTGKIAGIGPEQLKTAEVETRDYSDLTALEIPPIEYLKNGKSGKMTFNLYLCDRGRADRWNQPFLLYQRRPVGDGFISEIDEFSEHSRGLYELKLQTQVSELVKDLQLFFKSKNIFNFKIAKSTGFLSKENNEIEIVELAETTGTDANLEAPKESGDGVVVAGTGSFASVQVQEQPLGSETTINPELGTHGDGEGNTKTDGLGEEASSNVSEALPTKEGLERADTDINKPSNISEPHDVGGKDKNKKKGIRHKPKGFGMVFQDDEFNEDLSWFDEVNSVVIINSQHPRYLSRAKDESQLKSLMNYLAELYIWEITKLVHATDEDNPKMMKFLDYKFEYSENIRQDEKEGRFTNESE